MNVLKMLGYVFLGCGTVFVIVATFIFFNVIIPISQILFTAQQLSPIALTDCIPYLILATVSYAIGGTSYCTGRASLKTLSVPVDRMEALQGDLLIELRKQKNPDFNLDLGIIARDFETIEGKQNMVTCRTLVRTKKE